MNGPGKYDMVAGLARATTGAAGVILIVIDGAAGSGFSIQAPLELTIKLPAILRNMADEIAADVAERGGHG